MGMAECEVFRFDCVPVGPPEVWQGVQIISTMILVGLVIPPSGKRVLISLMVPSMWIALLLLSPVLPIWALGKRYSTRALCVSLFS
jgi:hypothetical protein